MVAMIIQSRILKRSLSLLGKGMGGGHGQTEPSSEREAYLVLTLGHDPGDLGPDLGDLGPDPCDLGSDLGDLGLDLVELGPDPGYLGLDLSVFWVCIRGGKSPKHDL